tara:strand:- start:699 stop:1172 length:474 start_codon:yes stop_codon:yes gene_type:complete
MKLRQARNKDGNQIISLIRKCYRDYPGCYLDVKNDSPELNYVYSYFKKNNGKFWVYERDKKIIGCMGIAPGREKSIEIHRLYIDKKYRRKGLAKKLLSKAENHALHSKIKKITLWTDTRFKESHKTYKSLNYKKLKKTRKIHDVSNTTEYSFIKILR